jgi:hypothetical protein
MATKTEEKQATTIIMPPERKQVARVEKAEEPASLLAVIARAASDPAIDLDKMDRLLQMQFRLETRAAEAAFNEAMAAAQAEIGRIKANKDNSQTNSRYADYAALDRILRPIYTKHGFALSFNTEEEARPDVVRVICLVSHSGYTRTYRVDMPSDGKGARGGDVMTKTHATGAAMTYGMRYLLKMIFNVAIGDDDTDGNMPSATITEQQAEEIKALLDEGVAAKPGTEFGGWLTNLLAFAKVDALLDIPAKDFGKVMSATRKAVNEAKKAAAK